MKFSNSRGWLLASAAGLAMCSAMPAMAANAETDANTDTTAAPITNGDDIIVTATKVNEATPITSSIHTFEPQAIVSRSIIENSIAPTSDYSQVILLTPSATVVPSSGNGVGLGDTKITLRGFVDGQYNMTYDGVPFGDSNDPTHHSTAYFPDGTYERIIVDRGPGGAMDLGQASYGGQVHIISREPADKFYIEGLGAYGSFDTGLGRLTVNTGAMDKLGGLKIIAVGEYKTTAGALSNQPGWFANGYVKAEKPLGDNALFSILANYNQSLFNQADGAGGISAAQIARFGKLWGAVSPSEAATSGYVNARSDWNWENKTTDMEIARLQVDFTPKIHFDNKVYTYSYKNFTLETDDPVTPCASYNGAADQCTGSGFKNVVARGPGAGGSGGPTIAGDIPGHTKLNQYRQWGDILQVNVDTSIGILKVGAWYEHSQSKRYQYEYDMTTASRAGGISNYNFNFAIMNNGSNYNWLAKNKPASFNVMANGQYIPDYINYDERTYWDNVQEFGEFDLKLLHDRLTITPGVKAEQFTRGIDTPIASQSGRVGIFATQTYKPVLPYATINYLIRPNLSVYAQYAKGYIVPNLSVTLETSGTKNPTDPTQPLNPTPTKTTNYQGGFVYAGSRLNVDADVYYIESSNYVSSDPTNPNIVTLNYDPARYKGVEGQVSYLIIPGLTTIANGSIMSSKDAVTGLWLKNTANYTALLGAVYNTGRFKLSYLHKFTGRQWADAANTARIAPYSYAVVSGSVAFDRFTVGVTVNNPWNNRAIVSQSGAPSASTLYIFQAPAAYEAQLKLRF